MAEMIGFSSAELQPSGDGWLAKAQHGDTKYQFFGKTREEAIKLLKEHLLRKKSA